MFSKLDEILLKYQFWVPLDMIDTQSFIKQHCETVQDFLSIISFFKVRKEDLEKLPDTEIVYECEISFFSFKRTVSLILDNLQYDICMELSSNIQSDFDIIDKYLVNATRVLNSKPCTIEEIMNAQTSWKDIKEKRLPMHDRSLQCEDMLRLLLSQTSESNQFNTKNLQLKIDHLDHSPVRT